MPVPREPQNAVGLILGKHGSQLAHLCRAYNVHCMLGAYTGKNKGNNAANDPRVLRVDERLQNSTQKEIEETDQGGARRPAKRLIPIEYEHLAIFGARKDRRRVELYVFEVISRSFRGWPDVFWDAIEDRDVDPQAMLPELSEDEKYDHPSRKAWSTDVFSGLAPEDDGGSSGNAPSAPAADEGRDDDPQYAYLPLLPRTVRVVH